METLTRREKMVILAIVSYCIFIKRDKIIDFSIIILTEINKAISKIISRRNVGIDDATLHDFVNPKKKVRITKDDIVNGVDIGNEIYHRMRRKRHRFPFKSDSPFLK